MNVLLLECLFLFMTFFIRVSFLFMNVLLLECLFYL